MDELNNLSPKIDNRQPQKNKLGDIEGEKERKQKVLTPPSPPPPPSVYIATAKKGSGIESRVVTYHHPNAPISEQYRIIRTNIQRLTPENPPRLIAITSALHQEGKTTTAVNLAVVMAQDLNKKIVLCDCDLRKPMIHKIMGLDSSKGITDILTHQVVDIEVVLQRGKVDNLTIIPCGRRPPNPSELLGSERMKELLKELRSHFDYILLDCPPVLAITDAGVISSQVDGVIMAVQAWRTQREAIMRSQSLLLSANAKLLGFVLTNVEHFVPKYLSHYGYGYQYGYYPYTE